MFVCTQLLVNETHLFPQTRTSYHFQRIDSISTQIGDIFREKQSRLLMSHLGAFILSFINLTQCHTFTNHIILRYLRTAGIRVIQLSRRANMCKYLCKYLEHQRRASIYYTPDAPSFILNFSKISNRNLFPL